MLTVMQVLFIIRFNEYGSCKIQGQEQRESRKDVSTSEYVLRQWPIVYDRYRHHGSSTRCHTGAQQCNHRALLCCHLACSNTLQQGSSASELFPPVNNTTCLYFFKSNSGEKNQL